MRIFYQQMVIKGFVYTRGLSVLTPNIFAFMIFILEFVSFMYKLIIYAAQKDKNNQNMKTMFFFFIKHHRCSHAFFV